MRPSILDRASPPCPPKPRWYALKTPEVLAWTAASRSSAPMMTLLRTSPSEPGAGEGYSSSSLVLTLSMKVAFSAV